MNENMPNRQLRTPMEMLIDSIRATEHDMKRTLHLIRGDAKRVDDEASALTARVKELEEENARLRKDFGKIFVSFLQDDRDGVGEIFTGVYTLDFTTGEPVFADSALNKEPTT